MTHSPSPSISQALADFDKDIRFLTASRDSSVARLLVTGAASSTSTSLEKETLEVLPPASDMMMVLLEFISWSEGRTVDCKMQSFDLMASI